MSNDRVIRVPSPEDLRAAIEHQRLSQPLQEVAIREASRIRTAEAAEHVQQLIRRK